MRWRLVSSMKTEYSLRALISLSRAPNRPASGPDMPASKRGFCRSNAASSVEPERGRPEMKCMVAKARSRPRVRIMPLAADTDILAMLTDRSCQFGTLNDYGSQYFLGHVG